jgi:gamma-glutamylcyclotransferase (GGCT)/AIG2-like uncharacterized protein YtfP
VTPLHDLDTAAIAAVLAAPASHRLFVYGTLLSTASGDYGQAARSRLLRDAALRTPARIFGQLYELGDYPGLVIAANQGANQGADQGREDRRDLVHGQLLVLADPAVTWPWLDDYEMISPEPMADNEYARVEQDVTLASGGPVVRAWVYAYCKPITRQPRIADGRWQSRPERKSA